MHFWKEKNRLEPSHAHASSIKLLNLKDKNEQVTSAQRGAASQEPGPVHTSKSRLKDSNRQNASFQLQVGHNQRNNLAVHTHSQPPNSGNRQAETVTSFISSCLSMSALENSVRIEHGMIRHTPQAWTSCGDGHTHRTARPPHSLPTRLGPLIHDSFSPPCLLCWYILHWTLQSVGQRKALNLVSDRQTPTHLQ